MPQRMPPGASPRLRGFLSRDESHLHEVRFWPITRSERSEAVGEVAAAGEQGLTSGCSAAGREAAEESLGGGLEVDRAVAVDREERTDLGHGRGIVRPT